MKKDPLNPLGTKSRLETGSGPAFFYHLETLEKEGIAEINQLPFSIKILLEVLLRHCDGRTVTEEDVVTLANWNPAAPGDREIAFMPARVLLQDFTGVPAVVDLAALRSAMVRLGGEAKRINPLIPVDLVIDHSIQVDFFGSSYALARNAEREFERNGERYSLLRWAQGALENFRVIPPDIGIVHQVNLEYLAQVVEVREIDGNSVVFPDTLVGTDSHTTMINGLGVLGWGVGGIEAEAVMLGQPYYMLPPQVVGLKLHGKLKEGATATDLVLTVTEMLRRKGVVGKFVEFYGPGLDELALPDRATIANMAPEYGATMGFFPVDKETLNYLLASGRNGEQIRMVERYTKEQGLFRTSADLATGKGGEPIYSDVLELDMGTVEPSLAGPKRPQDRIVLGRMKQAFQAALGDIYGKGVDDEEVGDVDCWYEEGGAAHGTHAGCGDVPGGGRGEISNGESTAQGEQVGGPNITIPGHGRQDTEAGTEGPAFEPGKSFLRDGAVVIAAITSCTNTSNPSVMIGAGLLAKKAVERGLSVPWYVKTSLAPGSRIVTDYLEESDLLSYLEALRFHVVGYGCTTCIGNSGPLPSTVAEAIKENDLVTAAVLSGNRNFEGRINPLTKANFLASPPLVIAYALAGRIDIDLNSEPLSYDPNGRPVYLRDIWPTSEEIQSVIRNFLKPEMFRKRYAEAFAGGKNWNQLRVPKGQLYQWDEESTYIKEPPFFIGLTQEPSEIENIQGARVLALLGGSVTTDHISPAGSISNESPAGSYLISQGVEPPNFNSFGSRRGNHEVMMRGTFGNIRLRNLLAPGTEGGVTIHLPSGEEMSIYDAAMRYHKEGTPVVVIAGKEYGTGSSRDWAAKGTQLLGVKAVLAESYERIHRSNLVGMGVLPLQFMPGESRESLGLTGKEIYNIEGLEGGLEPRKEVTVRVRPASEGNSSSSSAKKVKSAAGRKTLEGSSKNAGNERVFKMIARVDTPVEVAYYQNGGILQKVLREMLRSE